MDFLKKWSNSTIQELSRTKKNCKLHLFEIFGPKMYV